MNICTCFYFQFAFLLMLSLVLTSFPFIHLRLLHTSFSITFLISSLRPSISLSSLSPLLSSVRLTQSLNTLQISFRYFNLTLSCFLLCTPFLCILHRSSSSLSSHRPSPALPPSLSPHIIHLKTNIILPFPTHFTHQFSFLLYINLLLFIFSSVFCPPSFPRRGPLKLLPRIHIKGSPHFLLFYLHYTAVPSSFSHQFCTFSPSQTSPVPTLSPTSSIAYLLQRLT